MKKNVLLVTDNHLWNTGVPRVIMEIVRELSERWTFDVLIMAAKEEKGYYDEEFRSYGGEIFFCQLPPYRQGLFRYQRNLIKLDHVIQRCCKKKQYDAVEAHLSRYFFTF